MKINLIVNLNNTMLGLSFGPETVVTVGREMGCTISPLTADGLSRHHAKIFFKEDGWYVEDLGSTNGTFHATKKISEATKLATKDKLQFGRFELIVDEIVTEENAPEAAPVAASVPPVSSPLAEKPIAKIEEPAPAPAEPIAKVEEPVIAKIEEPAPAAAPAPAAPAAPTAKPVAPMRPMAPGGIRKPVLGGGALKPGLKMPPKPGLGAGLKLPPKPGLGAGLKLPPKPGLGGGALKPGLKMPPKPGFGAGLKLPPKKPAVAPAVKMEPVADMTPIDPNE